MEQKTNEPNLVRIERTGQIALVTLDKPPVNALFIDLFDALGRALETLEQDEKARVVILTNDTGPTSDATRRPKIRLPSDAPVRPSMNRKYKTARTPVVMSTSTLGCVPDVDVTDVPQL